MGELSARGAGDDKAGSRFGPRLIGNLRLRYEHANDDLQPLNASALTLRYRGTTEVDLTDRLTALGEIEAVGEITETFNDGRINWSTAPSGVVNKRKFRPVIADPGGVELNRAQAVFQFNEDARATIGRQRIILDDERFIGASAFRQNDRTFDAVRFNANVGKFLLVDGGYIRRVRRVIRDDAGFGFFTGDSSFVNLNAPAPFGRVALFHYALDLETGPQTGRNANLSSRTFGTRLEGRRFWGGAGVSWEASYARQVDFADNPTDFTANYWLGQIGLEKGALTISGRAEILSGDTDGRSFSTPLATLRQFQGNADVFFTTPSQGVVDVSTKLEWRLGGVGPFRDVRAFVRRHWFSAETTGEDFGVETDAEFSATIRGTTFSAALARYRSRGFATDIDRFFLSASHAF